MARVESVIFAKGLSAPQHSTYFVILLEGRDLEGTPGVAKNVTLFIERDDVKERDKSKGSHVWGFQSSANVCDMQIFCNDGFIV